MMIVVTHRDLAQDVTQSPMATNAAVIIITGQIILTAKDLSIAVVLTYRYGGMTIVILLECI